MYIHLLFFSIRFYSFVYFYIIWSIDKLLFYCRFAHQHTIVFIGFPSTERRRSSHVITGRTNGSWTVRHGAWKSAFDYLHGRDRLHRLVARRRQRRKFRLRSAADDDGVAEPARRVWACEEHQGADGDEPHRHSRSGTAQTGTHWQKDRIPEPEWGGMVFLPPRAAAVDRLDRSVWAFVSLAMMKMVGDDGSFVPWIEKEHISRWHFSLHVHDYLFHSPFSNFVFTKFPHNQTNNPKKND